MPKGSEPTISTEAMEEDPRWQLIERIAGTTPFSKSPRLRDFLRYISRLAIAGHGDEINEQSIGVAVFERHPNYDPSIDSIVRAHAVRLRSKLEEYFAGEGKSEPLQVSIPKGRYVPAFAQVAIHNATHAVPASTLLPAEQPQESLTAQEIAPHSQTVRSPGSFWKLVALGLAIACTVLATALYLEPPRAASAVMQTIASNPVARQFWGDLFSPGRTTVIVPGDNGLVLYENITGNPISLHDYLSGFRPRQPMVLLDQPQSAIAANLAWRRITTVMDLQVTTALERLPAARGTNLQITFARDLRPNDLVGQNAILIGASEANPWVELYEPSMNFVLQNDVQKHVFIVHNMHPKPSEQEEYFSNSDDPNKKIYAVAAFLPNLNGAGNVLILEGTSQAGTEAAAEFVFDTQRLTAFLNKIKGKRSGVPYFEVLLASHKYADSPSQSQVISYRVH